MQNVRWGTISFLAGAALMLTGCWPTKDLKHFTFYRECNNAMLTGLKTNGIFYAVQPKETSRFLETDLVSCFVLYRNGTYLDLTAAPLDQNVESTINKLVVDFQRNQKRYSNEFLTRWGAFITSGDTLKIQYYESWVMPEHGIITQTFKVFNRELKIFNDSTLQHGTLTYKLFKTRSKPDSVNMFATNTRVKKKLDRFYKRRHS